ncbi:MAG: hypothetical protein ABIH55_03700 [Nanoarchaeota archaeon]|nr:hypothetical protein [Nanoarchaeota archaeon]MBU1135411.1 hypothetical protein [Nanoarchaeota archaeon]
MRTFRTDLRTALSKKRTISKTTNFFGESETEFGFSMMQVIIFGAIILIIFGIIIALAPAMYGQICQRWPEFCGQGIEQSASATAAAQAIHCAITWSVTGDMNTPCGNAVVTGGGYVDVLKNAEESNTGGTGNNNPFSLGRAFSPLTSFDDAEIEEETTSTETISFQGENLNRQVVETIKLAIIYKCDQDEYLDLYNYVPIVEDKCFPTYNEKTGFAIIDVNQIEVYDYDIIYDDGITQEIYDENKLYIVYDNNPPEIYIEKKDCIKSLESDECFLLERSEFVEILDCDDNACKKYYIINFHYGNTVRKGIIDKNAINFCFFLNKGETYDLMVSTEDKKYHRIKFNYNGQEEYGCASSDDVEVRDMFHTKEGCVNLLPEFQYDDLSFGTDIILYFDQKNNEWVWRHPTYAAGPVHKIDGARNEYRKFIKPEELEKIDPSSLPGSSDPRSYPYATEIDPSKSPFFTDPENIEIIEWFTKDHVRNNYLTGLEKLFEIAERNNDAIKIMYSYNDDILIRYPKISDTQKLKDEIGKYPITCEILFGDSSSLSITNNPTTVACLFSGRSFSAITGEKIDYSELIEKNQFFETNDGFGCTVRNIDIPQAGVTSADNWADIRVAGFGDPDNIIYWQQFPADQDTWTYKPNWQLAAGIAIISAIPFGKVASTTIKALSTAGKEVAEKLAKNYIDKKLVVKILINEESKIARYSVKKVYEKRALSSALKLTYQELAKEGLIKAFKQRAAKIGTEGTKIVFSKRGLAAVGVGVVVGGTMWVAALIDSYNAKYNTHGNAIILKEPGHEEEVYKLDEALDGIPILSFWDPGLLDATRRKPFHLVSPCKFNTLKIEHIKTEDNKCVLCKPYSYVYNNIESYEKEGKLFLERGTSTCSATESSGDPSIYRTNCPDNKIPCSIEYFFDEIGLDMLEINSLLENPRNGEGLTVNDLFTLHKDEILSTLGMNENDVESIKPKNEIRNGETIEIKTFGLYIGSSGKVITINLYNSDPEDEKKIDDLYRIINENQKFEPTFEVLSFEANINNKRYELMLTDVNEDGFYDTYTITPECVTDGIAINVDYENYEKVERKEYNYCVNTRGTRQSGLEWGGVAIGTLGVVAASVLSGGSGPIIVAVALGGGGIEAYAQFADWQSYWPGPPAGNLFGPPILPDNQPLFDNMNDYTETAISNRLG